MNAINKILMTIVILGISNISFAQERPLTEEGKEMYDALYKEAIVYCGVEDIACINEQIVSAIGLSKAYVKMVESDKPAEFKKAIGGVFEVCGRTNTDPNGNTNYTATRVCINNILSAVSETLKKEDPDNT